MRLYKPKYIDRHGKEKTAGVWWIRVDPITGKRRSTGCANKEAALAWCAEQERIAADPHYAASLTSTIGHWVMELTKVKKRKAAGTQNMYRTKIGHVVRIFGERSPIGTITSATVDKFIEQRLTEGSGNNTIGKELTAILQLCKLAKRGGAYPGDIAALKPVGFSVNYVPRTRALTWEEIELLRARMQPEQFAVVAWIIATSGRRSEAARAQLEDHDTEQWLVKIRGTKTEASAATVPIIGMFRSLLSAALPYLPFSWSRISEDLPRITVALGLGRVTPNDLRRTTASLLFQAGVVPQLISKIHRHRDSRMIERVYAQASAEQVGALIAEQVRAGNVFDVSRQGLATEPAFCEQPEPKNVDKLVKCRDSGPAPSDLKSFALTGVPVQVRKGPQPKTRQYIEFKPARGAGGKRGVFDVFAPVDAMALGASYFGVMARHAERRAARVAGGAQ